MALETDVWEALKDWRPGLSLPAAWYHSDEAYRLDIERVFKSQWVFACAGAEISNAGDRIALTIGHEPIVVVRGEDGAVRAFHNVCRHRGSLICRHARESGPRLVCPYHQWTYDLSGALVYAADMDETFDPAQHSLALVHTQVLCGMVYICLADSPPDFARFRAAVSSFIEPHAPDRTKVAFQSRIVEAANWKLVVENNRECYHCASNHPELMASFVEVPLPGDTEGEREFAALMAEKGPLYTANELPYEGTWRDPEFRCVRVPFAGGAVSMTRDGAAASKILLGDLTEPDLGSVRLFHVPGNWNHFLSDYIVHTRALPISPGETEVVTTWLVHEDAVEGLDYDLERLTEVWIATNDQDKALAENNHLGTTSSAYRPGPYSRKEFLVSDFVAWYVATVRHEKPLAVAAE